MAARWSVVLAAAVLGGCEPQPSLTNEDRIVRATLRVLVSDGKPVCVEDRTRGAPLAVYKAMIDAPPESRRPLGWRQPGPLRPPATLSDEQIYRDQIEGQPATLEEPGADRARLPFQDQTRFDAAARRLAFADPASPNRVDADWVPGVTTRWWLANSLWSRCESPYTLSNPVWAGRMGFVTVSANHWATTYALAPDARDWRVIAQWSVWLY